MRSGIVQAICQRSTRKRARPKSPQGASMEQRELRGLIDRVRTRRLSRRSFIRRMMAVGLSAPMANQLLAAAGVAMAQTRSSYTPTPTWRRWDAEGPVVAGSYAAQPTFRDRHQGLGRLAHLLRAARQLGPERQSSRGAGGRASELGERWARRGRQVSHVEIEAGRPVARRHAVYCRRRGVQLGVLRAIRRPQQSPAAPTRTSGSRRSTSTQFACCLRRHNRSGPTRSLARLA